MALDGIVIASLVKELSEKLLEGRITKISQTESDELYISVKNSRETYKLLMSANATLPLVYITDGKKTAPYTAPSFCMLLRKHLTGAKIISVKQNGLDRIIVFEIEHTNELGDMEKLKLISELMGKHSNIILIDDNGTIIDSIKRVPLYTSSVRQVLPGKEYFFPEALKKADTLNLSEKEFYGEICSEKMRMSDVLCKKLNGISRIISEEILYEAGTDPEKDAYLYTDDEKKRVYDILSRLAKDIKEGRFSLNIYFKNKEPVDFSAVCITGYSSYEKKEYTNTSNMLSDYYSEKEQATRMRQKSSDLRKTVQNLIEKTVKKLNIQEKQLKDTEKRETFKLCGELLTAYAYCIPENSDKVSLEDYHSGKTVEIKLDINKTPMENAVAYYEKYNKQKRTYEALLKQTVSTRGELEHLDSIYTSLLLAPDYTTLSQIRDELSEYGYIKTNRAKQEKKSKSEKNKGEKSKPYHYITSEGYNLYIGKNNYQNEEVTFKIASPDDMWFHAKGIPGSHVILKANSKNVSDKALYEAACAAAYYSKNREQDKVEVDYVKKKELKKSPGQKPGFTIYHTNSSLLAKPDISGLSQV